MAPRVRDFVMERLSFCYHIQRVRWYELTQFFTPACTRSIFGLLRGSYSTQSRDVSDVRVMRSSIRPLCHLLVRIVTCGVYVIALPVFTRSRHRLHEARMQVVNFLNY